MAKLNVTFPMATDEDLDLARGIRGMKVGIPLHDGPLTLKPQDVSEEDIRRTADRIAAIQDQSARAIAIGHLLENLIRSVRDAQRLAGVVLVINKKTKESQAELLRRHPLEFPPPKG